MSDTNKTIQENSIIEIVCFTDPYCTWCWGSEPILNKIQEVYQHQVKISYVMGGLVEDISNFSDYSNGISGTQWYSQVASHWLEASSRHNMPVDEQIFFEIKDDWKSTHPACIAFKSSQFQGEELAIKYLRALRLGAAVGNKAIHKLEIQIELAKNIGLNIEKFIKDIENDNAQKAFKEDLLLCRKHRVRGFPSYLVKGDKDEVMLQSFTTYEQFVYWFNEVTTMPLSKRDIKDSASSIVDFITRNGKTAPMEIATICSLSLEKAQLKLKDMVQNGVLEEIKAGNGYLYSIPNIKGCDIQTGSCTK